MEEIIRKVVDADRQVRARVEQKQQERHSIQDLIQDQSTEVREKYRKETEDCIAKKRGQMGADLQNAMQQEEAAYGESLSTLQQKYEEHKEEWISQIAKRTLATQLCVRLYTSGGDVHMGMAEGVIVAKARSMHGEALSEEVYQELLRKRNVAGIAGYLERETSYATTLKDVRENNIHRGQLESILRQEIFEKTMKLHRYADTAVKPYYRLHMQQIEVDLILSRIRVLVSREYEAIITKFPIFLESYTSFNLLWLGNVHSHNELLDVLKHTIYYVVLLPYRVKKGGENDVDCTKIETQLQMQHYTHTFQVIDKTLKGGSRKTVKQYFTIQIKLSNIEKIYRYKKHFSAREDIIHESLVPVHEYLSVAFVEELIARPDARAFIKLLQGGTYHLRIEDMERSYIYIEHYTDSFLYALAKKDIYYPLDAPLVYSSYLYTAERELENVINVIEGMCYHVSIEDMERVLIHWKGECSWQF